MLALHITYYILLLVLLIAGLFISILGLPGLWLMIGSAGLYAWLTAGIYIGKWPLIICFALALCAEIAELIAGSAGAKRAGGTKRAMIGAIIGAMLGGIFLSFIPIPVISTIVGVCLGAFIGAAVAEMTAHGDVQQSMRVGVGAAQGRFYGIFLKLSFGIVIAAITLVAAFPYSRKASPAPTTLTAPVSTQPSTR